jgi:hypothetical protein
VTPTHECNPFRVSLRSPLTSSRRFKETKTNEEIAKFNGDLKSTIERARKIGEEGSKLNCALAQIDMSAVKAVYKKLKKVKMWDTETKAEGAMKGEAGVKRKSEEDVKEEGGGGKRMRTE